MKTIKITLLALFTIVGLNTMAQGKEQKSENQEVRKERINAFITSQLALTEAEKKAFLPIYNQYQAEKKALRMASKVNKKKGKIMCELTDQELEEVIQSSFLEKQKALELKKNTTKDSKKKFQ